MGDVSAWIAGLSPELNLPILGRLLLALLLGAAIGLEREFSGKPAGLRTIILICVGAELLTEISIVVGSFETSDLVRPDPGRIAAQIVSGIGFIGAGTILVYRGSVLGLTTAATLWVAAAIGIAVGARAYVPAVGATIFVILTLVVLRWLELHLIPDRVDNLLHVTLSGQERSAEALEAMLREHGFRISRLDVTREPDRTTFGYQISGERQARDRLLARLSEDERVRSARIE